METSVVEAARARPATPRSNGHRRVALEKPWCSLRDLPWWTPADQAEFDVLWRALLKGIDWHLARCPVAREQQEQGLPFWCRHLSGAVLEVLEWRDLREAYSRAVYLRRVLEPRP